MVVWRGSTATVTTASVSMDLDKMDMGGRGVKDIDSVQIRCDKHIRINRDEFICRR